MVIELKTFQIKNKKFAEYIKVKGPYKWQTDLRDKACFIYYFNGENTLYTRDGPVRSRGKEALLLKCGVYIDEIFGQKDEIIEALVIHFYPDLVKEIFQREMLGFLSGKDQTAAFFPVRIHEHVLLDRYIDNLLLYFKNPQLVDEELLSLKMKELFLLLSRTRQRKTLEKLFHNLFNPQEVSFRRIIEANLYTVLSIKDLAYLTHRSLSSFKRDFQRYYHTSPSWYIKNEKLKRAARLLATTDMRIGMVALECGFTNCTHFSRTFHKKYGMPPTAFRLSQTVY